VSMGNGISSASHLSCAGRRIARTMTKRKYETSFVVVDGDYPGQFKVAFAPGSAWIGLVPYVWESRAGPEAWIENDSRRFLARRQPGDELDDEISD
jgi:hypothetical protein